MPATTETRICGRCSGEIDEWGQFGARVDGVWMHVNASDCLPLAPIHKACGRPMRAGTYTYECARKDEYPDAVVWHDDECGMFQVDLPELREQTAYAIEWR